MGDSAEDSPVATTQDTPSSDDESIPANMMAYLMGLMDLPKVAEIKDLRKIKIIIISCSGEETYEVPYAVLIKKIPYLRYVLRRTGSTEDLSIFIHVEKDIFEILYEYFSGQNLQNDYLKLDPINVLHIMKAAEYFRMNQLLDICLHYVYDNISVIQKGNLELLSKTILARLSMLFSCKELDSLIVSPELKEKMYELRPAMVKLEGICENAKEDTRRQQYNEMHKDLNLCFHFHKTNAEFDMAHVRNLELVQRCDDDEQSNKCFFVDFLERELKKSDLLYYRRDIQNQEWIRRKSKNHMQFKRFFICLHSECRHPACTNVNAAPDGRFDTIMGMLKREFLSQESNRTIACQIYSDQFSFATIMPRTISGSNSGSVRRRLFFDSPSDMPSTSAAINIDDSSFLNNFARNYRPLEEIPISFKEDKYLPMRPHLTEKNEKIVKFPPVTVDSSTNCLKRKSEADPQTNSEKMLNLPSIEAECLRQGQCAQNDAKKMSITLPASNFPNGSTSGQADVTKMPLTVSPISTIANAGVSKGKPEQMKSIVLTSETPDAVQPNGCFPCCGLKVDVLHSHDISGCVNRNHAVVRSQAITHIDQCHKDEVLGLQDEKVIPFTIEKKIDM